MPRWSVLVVALLSLGALAAKLPTYLPADFIASDDFIEIQRLSPEEGVSIRAPKNYIPAPIATEIRFNSQLVRSNDYKLQEEVFAERTYVRIPSGQRIRVTRDSQNREVWNYPAGTTVVDMFLFRDKNSTVFELRIVQKQRFGKWAFGSYSPDSQGRLKRNLYEGWKENAFDIPITQGPRAGQSVKVELKQLRLSACQSCHFANSPADYQYEKFHKNGKLNAKASMANTGFCGFTPNNPHVTEEWAPRFQQKFGYWPFEVESR